MRSRHAFLLAICLSGLLGCTTPNTLPRATYLARVNQDPITMDELKAEFKRRHGGHERFLAWGDEIKRFLNAVIDQRLLMQEAYRIGLHERPEIVEAGKNFEEQKLREHLIKKEVDEKSKATDEEVKAVYDQKLDEMFLVQQIVVESKEEAEEILKKVQAGGDFEALAREKSIAESKKYGGRLPPMGWGIMDPEWERIAFGLSQGKVSSVFKSKMGYEIVRLEEKKSVTTRPEFEKVQRRIKGILERRKLEERRKELADYLKKKYPVQIGNTDLTLEELKKAVEEKKEDVLASWDGGKITVSSFASQLNMEKFAALPASHVKDQIKEVLQELVDQKLMVKEALARGYEKVPEVSEKVRQYREELMENLLYGNYILSDLKVADEDLKRYFDENRKDYFFPEKRKIAHIMGDNLDTAKDILKKLREGARFEDLASTSSKDDKTAKKGGEIGWIGKGDVIKVFEKTAFALNAGEVSDPVPTEYGYHIIKLLAVQPARSMEFSQAREAVGKKVLKKKRDEKVKFWTDKLRSVSQIEINEEGIKAAAREAQEELSKKAGMDLGGGKGKAGHGKGKELKKEEPTKEEPEKEDPKKEDPKKEDPKKEDPPKENSK